MNPFRILNATVFCLLVFAAPGAKSAGPLVASTYLGGSNKDGSLETPIVVDAEGNIFIASRTRSTNFPVIEGSYDADGHNGGTDDVFISKFSPDLTTLLASTYLGGTGDEGTWPGVAMAIDPEGNIYVAGRTTSSDFPHTYGSLSGYSDAFVAKFDNNLENLLASRLLGGTNNEYFLQLAIDADGNVFVSGTTSSSNFVITPGAFQRAYAGGGDGPYPGDLFVSKYTSDLSSLLASTFVGGGSYEYCEELVISADGDVYLAGWVGSTNFPTTTGAYDRSFGGGVFDAFVTALSNDLTSLVASTYLGAYGWDFIYGMALDGDGNVYVTGHTQSTTFPTTPGAWDRIYSGSTGDTDDAFISKFDPSLQNLLASTYLGESGWDFGMYLAFTETGDVLIAGNTGSIWFPVSAGGYDPTYNYGWDNFIALMDNNLTLVKIATFLGGASREMPTALVLLQSGDICIGSATVSSDFPTVETSYDTTFNGSGGAWASSDNYGGDAVITIMAESNFSDADPDGDGIPDYMDNCCDVPNPSQADFDNDRVGDDCDICTDSDGDHYGDPGFPANTCLPDNCPYVSNEDGQNDDADGDGVGDACDICPGFADNVDTDSDGVPDGCDNCPYVSNEGGQEYDADQDGVGDACDVCPGYADTDDTDSDGVPDGCDSCPDDHNPEQGCCCLRVGDANSVGTYPNEVTISDVQLLLTAKFISSLPCEQNLPCLTEADVNQSGGANPTCNDITISDIQMLVNHLFIAGPVNAPLKECL